MTATATDPHEFFLPLLPLQLEQLQLQRRFDRLLRQLDAEFEIAIAAGRHPLSLRSVDSQLIVQPQTIARLVLRATGESIGTGNETTRHSNLELGDLRFSPPLRIANLIGAELPLERWLSLLPKRLRLLLGSGLRGANAAVEVEIGRIVLQRSAHLQPAVRREPVHNALLPHVEGHVEVFGVRLPLSKLRLPEVLAAAETASLERILRWLDRLSPRIVEQLWELVVSSSGELSIDCDPVGVIANTTTRGGYQGRVRLRTDRPVSLNGRVVTRVERGMLKLSSDALRWSDETGESTVGFVWQRPVAQMKRHCAATRCELRFVEGQKRALPKATLDGEWTHPALHGVTRVSIGVQPRSVAGALGLDWPSGARLPRLIVPERTTFDVELAAPQVVSRLQRGAQIAVGFDGRASGQIFETQQSLDARCQLDGQWRLRMAVVLGALPELALDNGELTIDLKASLDGQLGLTHDRRAGALELEVARFRSEAIHCEIDLDGRQLVVPSFGLRGTFEPARLNSIGIAPFGGRIEGWIAAGEYLLAAQDKRLSVHHGRQLGRSYGVQLLAGGRFWLIDDAETASPIFGAPPTWLTALWRYLTDGGAQRLADAAVLFSRDFSAALKLAAPCIERLQAALDAESIVDLATLIPPAALSRVLSRWLSRDLRHVDVFLDAIRSAIDGRGLPITRLRRLLFEELAEYDLDRETSGFLAWLDLALQPGDRPRLLTVEQRVVSQPPREDSGGADLASLIEEAASSGRGLDQQERARILAEARDLRPEQIALLLGVESQPPEFRAQLRRLLRVKRSTASVARGEPGWPLFGPHVIATIIADCQSQLVGSSEVAALMRQSLHLAARFSPQAQLNLRQLLEILLNESGQMLRGTLIEMSEGSVGALVGLLYALLNHDQSQLRTPMDIVSRLSDCLDLEVPRRADYMAGGARARQSYFDALSTLATRILTESDQHYSRLASLRYVRRRAGDLSTNATKLQTLESLAQQAIERADAVGVSYLATHSDKDRTTAIQHYEKAFSACADLLRCATCNFQLPWFRAFWARNEEALRVLSVVRAYQEQRDRVRHWLDTAEGNRRIGDEQDLLEACVHALYWRPEDRRQLLSDPLVRLLIEPEGGHYHFSIVSCMGLITAGAGGTELESSYQRLRQQRGIQIYRADTATVRSLEYNAERIVAAIRCCETPWGFVGYSQGCASALLAESMLLGGVPEERGLLDTLVARNWLFSAANGSAHGSAGLQKYLRAMSHGERLLKHYQGIYSQTVIDGALTLAAKVFDSPLFVHFLGGAQSISYERALELQRDAQLRYDVPTSTTRAVVTLERVPQALEMFCRLLDAQTGGADHDTQVVVEDAAGYAARISNQATRNFARTIIPSMVQATHHWAPLQREVVYLKTERDRRLAVYDSPKDQLVWPWVEVNARFGRIRRT